jgi:hypothetical protein
MTLGEFARSVSREIVACARKRSDVRDVIGSAAEFLADNHLPPLQMQWFWQQVADHMTAHRPIEEDEFTGYLTAALNAVHDEITSCELQR